MIKSEKPLRSCPLSLAISLCSSMVLRHVPTMEQCIDVENSQSFLRCQPGPSSGPVDPRLASRDIDDAGVPSTALVLGSVITVCGGTIVILRPWGMLEKPDRDVHQSPRSPMYTWRPGATYRGTAGDTAVGAPHSRPSERSRRLT